ncbi:hypothetical protein [Nocardia asiatica]|uniref:hypothetical protein n=1 Tax=Nocardia asiatica TaxID=209252 RepID=UPI0002F05880|nr:hypothetical protein [Nocardia asiatica]
MTTPNTPDDYKLIKQNYETALRLAQEFMQGRGPEDPAEHAAAVNDINKAIAAKLAADRERNRARAERAAERAAERERRRRHTPTRSRTRNTRDR